MRTLVAAWLFAPAMLLAAEGAHHLDSAPIDPRDLVSLQAGARTFVNYCLNCHGAKYMRYNRLTDLGLTETQIRDNLMLAADKVGETMAVAMTVKDGKEWFGVPPPDLSVIGRSRGADWLYTYLRTFYRDDNTSSGLLKTSTSMTWKSMPFSYSTKRQRWLKGSVVPEYSCIMGRRSCGKGRARGPGLGL